MDFMPNRIINKNSDEKINLITKTTDLAMHITLEYIKKGDAVIDATAGNGHDTLLLAEAIGENGKVFAFDIQKQALENTEKLLKENGMIDRVQLVNDSHENLLEYFSNANTVDSNINYRVENRVKDKEIRVCSNGYVDEAERPSAVIFNLGYLPMGDKTITTKGNSSISAISEALKLIKIGGVVTLVLYSGHEEGKKEKQMILEMLQRLSSKEFHVAYTSMINQANNPPEIVWITKKR